MSNTKAAVEVKQEGEFTLKGKSKPKKPKQLGNKEQAIKELDVVLVNVMESLKPKVLFSKGRILFQLGKKNEADTIFTELTQKFANSQEAKKVAALKMIAQ